MSLHILIVGHHPSSPNSEFDEIARIAALGKKDTVKVRRCASPAELLGVVRDVVRECNAPVGILDLYDHGGEGYLRMGDPVEPPVFAHEGIGEDLARALAPFLLHDARVRLLGCDTATGVHGQRMLSMLQSAFGKAIVVFGTIASVGKEDFGEGGFRAEREEMLLFSSTEATKDKAPTYAERRNALNTWRQWVG